MKNIFFWITGIIFFYIVISIILGLVFWLFYNYYWMFMLNKIWDVFIWHVNLIGAFNIVSIIDLLIIVVGWYMFWSFIWSKVIRKKS